MSDSNHSHQQRKPEEIESDIKQHRQRLDETLGEMEERFSPEKLVNSAFDYVRHGGANEFASNLSGSIKTNPTPFLVATIGLGWLFWSQRNGNQGTPSSNPGYRQYDPYAASTAGEAMAPDDLTAGMPGDTQSHAQSHTQSHSQGRAAVAGDKARHMSDNLKNRTHDMSSGLHDGASRLGHGSRDAMHGASDRAHDAGHQTAEFIREHPVMAGALGIAIGAALGGILPSTRTEDQHFGSLRDKAVDRASEEGSHYAEKAHDQVHEKAEQSRKDDNSDSQRSGTSKPAGTPGAGSTTASTSTTAEEINKGQTAVPPSATTPGTAKEATDNEQHPLGGGTIDRSGVHDTPRRDGDR
ncbi:DUF3618 domain-containing protein [Salinicola halophyticus]|uniref:DUF3618 domain-containing protein n=1 Tax=Salinicola halophyticus TaxID=1808881 RepID=UPI003F45BDBF